MRELNSKAIGSNCFNIINIGGKKGKVRQKQKSKSVWCYRLPKMEKK